MVQKERDGGGGILGWYEKKNGEVRHIDTDEWKKGYKKMGEHIAKRVNGRKAEMKGREKERALKIKLEESPDIKTHKKNKFCE